MRRSYFFVRHGRAVYQDRDFRREDHPPTTDWPLSPRGLEQARSVAAPVLRFGIERVLSSGLARARETAQAIAEQGRVPYEHRWSPLNEIHPESLRRGHSSSPESWSWTQGWRVARVVRKYARTGRRDREFDVRGLEERVLGVLGRLDALDEERVVVVGHGFWILLASLLVRGEVRYRWIDNCSVTRIDADGEGRYRLVSFAQVLR